MKLGNNWRTMLLSHVFMTGLIGVNLPAMAASMSLNNQSHSVSPSTMLLAGVNSKYVQEANQHMTDALKSMNAAAKAEPTAAVKHFNDALKHLEAAVNALLKAGMPETANTLNSAIENLKAAVATDNAKEEDKLITDAVDGLNKVDADIQKALS